MQFEPKVSVVIPTYNYAHYLDDAIQSVLDQTYSNYELIIVDNCSTDNTDKVVAKYLSDKRVSYYKNETNVGLVGNWNKCLEYAKGEYIKFLCADDKFHPEILEKYVAVMDLYPNVSLITCDKQLFGDQPWYVKLPLEKLQKGREVIIHTLKTKSWIGEPTSVMFRRRDLEKTGVFRNDYTLHVDWELWIRLLNIGDCFIMPEALVYVRAHTGQHTKKVINLRCFEEYQMSKLLNVYEGFSTEVPKDTIEEVIKQKATYCTKQAMYKEIPYIYKKESRDFFFKAFKIALKEHVFTSGLLQLLQGAKAKARGVVAH